MEGSHSELITWLMEMGISPTFAMWLLRAGVIVCIALLTIILDKFCKILIFPAIRKMTSKTSTHWDDYLLNDNVLKYISRLVPPIVFYMVFPLAFPEESAALSFMLKLCWAYVIFVIAQLLCAVISALYAISTDLDTFKTHSLKGFYQMLKLVVWCIAAIIIISLLIDKNPIAILTGLGAGTAILMLVFQDTIKGLVAGIQLMANDMLRPGDWITVPKYGADGDVLEVTLTTVKVQNWDKTIVTVPPYALVNDSFQNWRGMFDIGGRRIKRSINIDMQTVRFCTDEEMKHFMKQPWMEDFEPTDKKEVNLYIFRHYLEYYLRNHPKVSQDLIMTVRQLQPTAEGLPLELYFFSADTRWIKYEHLQAEVFEHVIAMLRTFDLKVFQSPSGADLQNIKKC